MNLQHDKQPSQQDIKYKELVSTAVNWLISTENRTKPNQTKSNKAVNWFGSIELELNRTKPKQTFFGFFSGLGIRVNQTNQNRLLYLFSNLRTGKLSQIKIE